MDDPGPGSSSSVSDNGLNKVDSEDASQIKMSVTLPSEENTEQDNSNSNSQQDNQTIMNNGNENLPDNGSDDLGSDRMETDSMEVNYSINSNQILTDLSQDSETMETDVTLSEDPSMTSDTNNLNENKVENDIAVANDEGETNTNMDVSSDTNVIDEVKSPVPGNDLEPVSDEESAKEDTNLVNEGNSNDSEKKSEDENLENAENCQSLGENVENCALDDESQELVKNVSASPEEAENLIDDEEKGVSKETEESVEERFDDADTAENIDDVKQESESVEEAENEDSDKKESEQVTKAESVKEAEKEDSDEKESEQVTKAETVKEAEKEDSDEKEDKDEKESEQVTKSESESEFIQGKDNPENENSEDRLSAEDIQNKQNEVTEFNIEGYSVSNIEEEKSNDTPVDVDSDKSEQGPVSNEEDLLKDDESTENKDKEESEGNDMDEDKLLDETEESDKKFVDVIDEIKKKENEEQSDMTAANKEDSKEEHEDSVGKEETVKSTVSVEEKDTEATGSAQRGEEDMEVTSAKETEAESKEFEDKPKEDVEMKEEGSEKQKKLEGSSESVSVDDKEQQEAPEGENEMCLQISSVTGSADIPTMLGNEKEETKKPASEVIPSENKVEKKEDGGKMIKEEKKEEKDTTITSDVKKEPEKTVKKEETPAPKSEIKQDGKSSGSSKSTSKTQTCIVCKKTGKCKYNIVRNGDIKHLCDDTCFKQFRSNPTVFLRQTEENASSTTNKPEPPTPTPTTAPPAAQPPQERYKTCSVCQLMDIKTSKPFLSWQALDFCGEDCLGKFQSNLNAACSFCASQVQRNSKGKHCLRVGDEVKQFCTEQCHMKFKKRQKICECCQKDLKNCEDAFVAPVGNDGTFKDFCSQSCLQKYEDKTNRDVEIVGVDRAQKSQVLPKGNFQCAVCSKSAPVQHEIKLDGKMNRLCSDPCFSAFQYANKLTMNTCDNCGVYCYNDWMQPQYIQFEGQQKRFCSFMCVNTFKNKNKKTVACAWCNSKKSNFDMIERVDANNKYQLFCSLNCLSLYRVNLQATSNQAVTCDQCRKFVPAQYHLTMSDASVRNFCSYSCVMTFQSQFTGGNKVAPPKTTTIVTQPQQQTTVATTTTAAAAAQNNRVVGTRQSSRVAQKQQTQPTVPVISNVVSLAPKAIGPQVHPRLAQPIQRPLYIPRTGVQQPSARAVQPASTTPQQMVRTAPQPPAPQPPPVQKTIQTQVVIQPPPPKQLKNKSLLCKPFVQTKATSCRPHTQTKETQTDGEPEKKPVLIPVPVPIYIPVPMGMYTQPTPVPLPIPIPIPVPCFIPTTKKNADSILKQIKEIREKIPSDPLEAELLMMAEAVAGGDNESDSDTDNDAEEPAKEEDSAKSSLTGQGKAGTQDQPGTENNEFGEDMLQMALRMATEMNTEPAMDLESSIEPVPVNTEPPPPPPQITEHEEDEDEYVPPRETRSKGRGTKRSSSGRTRRSVKKPKVEKQHIEQVEEVDESSNTAVEQEPPPDANMYLKYTYGVNAWKHWVVHKNAQLEKVTKQGSGKLKLFKTDMLQCSADELNYSLCLFVKEVRKPNGDEYAPDSIYYLCLGIQQYLFESGRIDNIFTDLYYEKFTECLNEVLIRYEPKINISGQLVCRIEEEHLWECKQLGAHSPHVLLNTLVYFNTKYFMLKSAEDHMKLSFTHIMKHWKKTPIGKSNTTGRSVYLRYYCPTPTKTVADVGQKKKKEELPVYEQAENLENPLRCPVKLYEFYLSKCPESIKNRNDAFYLVPERSCVPDSPVWYSTQNLQVEAMNKMLHRLRLVREIQEAQIHTQPVYAS